MAQSDLMPGIDFEVMDTALDLAKGVLEMSIGEVKRINLKDECIIIKRLSEEEANAYGL